LYSTICARTRQTRRSKTVRRRVGVGLGLGLGSRLIAATVVAVGTSLTSPRWGSLNVSSDRFAAPHVEAVRAA
jgi:hypothetical protein